jgi:tetratricopeptide (TPR) repeat protein
MMRLLFVLLALAVSIQSMAGEGEARELNNLAAEKIIGEDYESAIALLSQALGENPFLYEGHLNLGVALLYLKRPDEALRAARSALEQAGDDDENKFMAYFNIGGAEALSGNIDAALEAYQAALKINPNSVVIKENIEILMQEKSGGGKGSSENQDENQDKGDKGEQDRNDPNRKYEQNKKQEFKSKELSERDVKKIFEELLQQENKIRREFEKDKRGKGVDREKDW